MKEKSNTTNTNNNIKGKEEKSMKNNDIKTANGEALVMPTREDYLNSVTADNGEIWVVMNRGRKTEFVTKTKLDNCLDRDGKSILHAINAAQNGHSTFQYFAAATHFCRDNAAVIAYGSRIAYTVDCMAEIQSITAAHGINSPEYTEAWGKGIEAADRYIEMALYGEDRKDGDIDTAAFLAAALTFVKVSTKATQPRDNWYLYGGIAFNAGRRALETALLTKVRPRLLMSATGYAFRCELFKVAKAADKACSAVKTATDRVKNLTAARDALDPKEKKTERRAVADAIVEAEKTVESAKDAYGKKCRTLAGYLKEAATVDAKPEYLVFTSDHVKIAVVGGKLALNVEKC